MLRNAIDDFWKREFGESQEARDYTGRKILRNHFGQMNHRFGWVTELIFPFGCTYDSNLHAVHVMTQVLRHRRISFDLDGMRYGVAKQSFTDVGYDYSHKDFCITCLDDPLDFWTQEFGAKTVAVDFAGVTIRKELFGRSEEGGWNIDHILPLARSGEDCKHNYQIASIAANSQKADRLEFDFGGRHYRVKRSTESTPEEWHSTPYDYLRKDYCVVKENREQITEERRVLRFLG